MATGEVHHGAVGTERDEVAAERHLVGPQAQAEGRGLDRRPTGVELGRVVPEDRHVADVAARREARGDDGGPPGGPARGEGSEHRELAVLQRGLAAQLGNRLIGATVGDTDDVLHRPIMPALSPVPTRGALRTRELVNASAPHEVTSWVDQRSLASMWACTAARSLGSAVIRSSRSKRSCSRSGRAGRWPVACSTASGNLAGWAVARQTTGALGVGAGELGRDAQADRGVRVDHLARAAGSGVDDPERGGVVDAPGREGLIGGGEDVRDRSRWSRHRGRPPSRHPGRCHRDRRARTAAARGCWTPGCPWPD